MPATRAPGRSKAPAGSSAAGRVRAVVVAGCFPQREHERLFDMFPEIDAVMGVDELRDVAAIVARLEQGDRLFSLVSGRPRRLFEPGRTARGLQRGPARLHQGS